MNIVDSLQKSGLKKTGAERALASLVAKGTVHKKEYGKSNIFILSQGGLELPDAEEAAAVDAEVKELTARVGELGETLGGLRGRVSELQGTLSLDEAVAELERVTAVVAAKEERLSKLGDGSRLLSKEDKLAVEAKYFALLSAWRTRKRLVKNVADAIGESCGMKAKEFYGTVGVETDEDAGVDLAGFPQVENPAKAARPAHGGRPAAKRQKTS